MLEYPWEDNLLEKKVESDLKDLLKTLVAFANSVKPDHIAVLLIGEKNDGTVQGVKNPDNIQKKVREESDKIFPPILWHSTVYEREGRSCIRVEVEYDGETPHFGGSSWVRKGSETIIATDEMFQRLIDLRSGIVYELAKWLNKEITIFGDPSTIPQSIWNANYFSGRIHRWGTNELVTLVFVNSYWVTFKRAETGEKISEPLNKLTLSYDDQNDRLKVIVDY